MDRVDPTSCAIRPYRMMLKDGGGRIDQCPARRTLQGNATCSLQRRRCAERSGGMLRFRSRRACVPRSGYTPSYTKRFLLAVVVVATRAAKLRAFQFANG